METLKFLADHWLTVALVWIGLAGICILFNYACYEHPTKDKGK